LTITLPDTISGPRKTARGSVGPPPVVLPAPAATPPLVIGGDLSLTATALAWPDAEVKTHGRDGLTGTKLSPGRKAVALSVLARELYFMTTGRPNASGITLLMVEMLPTTGTRVNSERCYLWHEYVRLCQGLSGIPIIDVPPTSLKLYITGMGDANKREVLAAVAKLLPQFDIRRHGKSGKPLKTLDDNRADAAVLCAMGMDLLGHPLVEVPARNRAALHTLALPEGIQR
jgi:hypothetical protein